MAMNVTSHLVHFAKEEEEEEECDRQAALQERVDYIFQIHSLTVVR